MCASVLAAYVCVCVSMRALKQQKVAQWHLIYDCSASEVKTLKIFSQTHKIRRTTTRTRQGVGGGEPTTAEHRAQHSTWRELALCTWQAQRASARCESRRAVLGSVLAAIKLLLVAASVSV